MLDPRDLIKKTNLTFAAKFLWLLFLQRLSLMAADNILTWDRAVMVASLVAMLEIDLSRLLIFVIHERAFKTSTIYPFACVIFQLCRDAGVSLWHSDVLHTLTRSVDIGLIRDVANVTAPRRGPRVDLQTLSENLADTVMLDQELRIGLRRRCLSRWSGRFRRSTGA